MSTTPVIPPPPTFSTDDYHIPEWSHPPRYSYHLQIIKDGSIIGNVNLKQKQFILIGRVSDLCDLFIDNPSISRKHAILQFRRGDDLPYLYDLGGKHGTEVNRQKLPVRAYQRVRPFDMIKFGVSSRYYVLRCPELEHLEKENENEADNKFQQLLAQRKKQLSKQQLKDKYLQLLQNDPYHKSSNLSKKLQGADQTRNINGVDWGISDQYQVYAYRNESEFQLQPDLIRRLPGLDQTQLNKISDYETNLRKYEEIQGELNQLGNRERREFGLEEKMRDRKEKLEKKFVEAVEALEKAEDWIRVNLFGDKEARVVRKERVEKEDDTFENDQFFDRTIKDKKNKNQNQQQLLKQKATNQVFTTQDFWKLQKQLRNELQNLINLQKQLQQQNPTSLNPNQPQSHHPQQPEPEPQQPQQQQQQDDLDAYMLQNNQTLQKQHQLLTNERLTQTHKKIQQIKNYLIPLVGATEVQKIEDEERGVRVVRYESTEEKGKRRDKENRRKIQETLRKLDVIKEMEEDLDQEDVRIFQYYKDQQIREQENEDEEQQDSRRYPQRHRPPQLQTQSLTHQPPQHKLYPQSSQSSRDKNQQQQEEPCYDLTKFK